MKKFFRLALSMFLALSSMSTLAESATIPPDGCDSFTIGEFSYKVPSGWLFSDDDPEVRIAKRHFKEKLNSIAGGYIYVGVWDENTERGKRLDSAIDIYLMPHLQRALKSDDLMEDADIIYFNADEHYGVKYNHVMEISDQLYPSKAMFLLGDTQAIYVALCIPGRPEEQSTLLNSLIESIYDTTPIEYPNRPKPQDAEWLQNMYVFLREKEYVVTGTVADATIVDLRYRDINYKPFDGFGISISYGSRLGDCISITIDHDNAYAWQRLGDIFIEAAKLAGDFSAKRASEIFNYLLANRSDEESQYADSHSEIVIDNQRYVLRFFTGSNGRVIFRIDRDASYFDGTSTAN
ncbi:MAG: hypothetical protein FWD25_02250 [Clostridia bacterium]|nr:hypothetical protein [Clostridia bacterium]